MDISAPYSRAEFEAQAFLAPTLFSNLHGVGFEVPASMKHDLLYIYIYIYICI